MLHLSPTEHPCYQNHATALRERERERNFNKLEEAGAQGRLDLLHCQKNPSAGTHTKKTCTAEGMERISQLRRLCLHLTKLRVGKALSSFLYLFAVLVEICTVSNST